MQGIYTYIPETNCVPREYSVAAILLLLYMVLISLVPVLNLLYFYISTFRSMCAVPNMAVFWCSLTSCFPGMLLTYFLNDFEIVPVASIITAITFVFIFHIGCIYIVRYYYYYYYYYYKGRDSLVGVATRYGLNGRGIESRWGREFPHPSRLALVPIQPATQWVPGLFPRGKATGVWRWPPTPSTTKVKERVEL